MAKSDSKTGDAQKSEISCVIFRLGERLFALPISQIREITQTEEIAPLPNAPATVSGMIDIRGRLLPVVDLGEKIRVRPKTEKGSTDVGAPVDAEEPEGSGESILIVEFMGEHERERTATGLLVEEVLEVFYAPIDSIEPAPQMALVEPTACVAGVFKRRSRMILLLDCRKMFSPGELGIEALGA